MRESARHAVVGRPVQGRKLLLIASSGGHLAELHRLREVLDPARTSLWVTFDGPQARTLLAGERVMYLPYIKPRGAVAILRSMVLFAFRMRLTGETFDAAVSTGSGIALACFPVTRAMRVESTYIESVGRTRGPSVTGRLLRCVPGVRLRTQSSLWAKSPWELHPSVLTAHRVVEGPAPERPRLFITLGTIRGYRFDALLDAVLALGIADDSTVWQVGETDRDDLPGEVHQYLSADEYRAAALAADVVVSHAGVGALLVLLELGVYPLMVVRRAHRGEHVDDHQRDMEHLLAAVAVGEVIEVEGLGAEVIDRASRRRVARATSGSDDDPEGSS